MKKFITLFIAMFLSIGTITEAKGLDLEGVVGMNVANLDAAAASSRIGFHVGLRGTYAFSSPASGLYANGAALLSLKGAKVLGITFNPYYIEIPVHIGYKYGITNNVAMFGEFGPYFGIGVFGTTEGEDVFGDVIGYNRFDVGLGIRAGFEFNQKFNVSLGYDFGLADVADDASLKNRNFTISLGYKF